MPRGTIYENRGDSVSERYSEVAFADAKWRIDQYLQKNKLDPLSNDTFTPEQAKFVLDNENQVKEEMSRDYFTYRESFAQNQFLPVARLVNPDYRSIPVREQIARENLGKALQEKVNRYETERKLSVCYAGMKAREFNKENGSEKGLPKPEQTLLDPRFDKASRAKNEERVKLLCSPKAENKQKAYMDFLQETADLADELSRIDIMDDKTFVENYDKFSRAAAVGGEIANKLRDAEKLGLNFRNDAYTPMLAKLAMVEEYGKMAKLKTDIICHPSYSQMDMAQLTSDYAINNYQVTMPDGEQKRFSHALADQLHSAGGNLNENTRQRLTRSYEVTASQLKKLCDAQTKTGSLFDTNLPLQDRADLFKQQFQKMDHPVKTPKNNPQKNGKDQPLPEDEKERHDFLRKKFETNLKIIQGVLPNFKLSDQEIEKYISKANVEHQQKEIEYQERKMALAKKYPNAKKVMDPFPRIINYMLDESNTPEADAYNNSMIELLSSKTPEGEAFRKTVYSDILNKVQEIDANKLDGNATFEERVKYAEENRDLMQWGYDLQYVTTNTKFKASPDKADHVKEVVGRAVTLGGVGYACARMAGNEYALTLPYRHLTAEQMMQLQSTVAEQLEYTGKARMIEKADIRENGEQTLSEMWNPQQGILALYSFGMASDMKKDYEKNLPPQTYGKDDFTRIRTDVRATEKKLNDYRNSIHRLYEGLRNDDALLSMNSSEYKKLVAALAETDKAMSALDGNVTAEQRKKIENSFQEVSEKANLYIQHVGAKPKEGRQTRRLEMAKQVLKAAQDNANKPDEMDHFFEYHNQATLEELDGLNEATHITEEYRRKGGYANNVSAEEYLDTWMNSAKMLRDRSSKSVENPATGKRTRVPLEGNDRRLKLAELGIAAVKNAKYYLEPMKYEQPPEGQRMSPTKTFQALGVYQMYCHPVKSSEVDMKYVPLVNEDYTKLGEQGGIGKTLAAVDSYMKANKGKLPAAAMLKTKLANNEPIFNRGDKIRIGQVAAAKKLQDEKALQNMTVKPKQKQNNNAMQQ